MSKHRQFHIPALRFFFTVRLKDSNADLLTRHIDLLRLCFRVTQKTHPFGVDEAVVLPNRLHMIWSLPASDRDYGTRLRLIKTSFARHVPVPRMGRATPGIWQRRYWEQPIQSQDEYRSYARMIAEAPVNDGLAKRVGEWPHATATAAIDPIPLAQAQ